MKKINNKSINLGLKILTILAFALIFMPFNKASAYCGESGCNYVYGGNYQNDYIANNPQPSIDSISPSYANMGSRPETITITGNGFIPSSVARVDGSDRNTTFIDSSHLFIHLTQNDMCRDGGFYITVWNGQPGGGFSNSDFFTLNRVAPSAVYSNNGYNNNYQANNCNTNNCYNPNAYNNYPNSNQPYNGANINNSNDTASGLASSTIFGSGSFFPSGLIQWILFAIIILIVVILVRKVFGARKNYEETPLKHD